MKYQNPVVRGMYPDPSVCRAGDKYYMVCSSNHFFPAVPLFESRDMVNWQQIGHCITRQSQVDLSDADKSGGIFAPTIRYYRNRFYMVTTKADTHTNFYVWTDNIHGEWSEPVFVEQDGIDPSLYFEEDRTYFISNGYDAESGRACIQMCEIDIETGKKKSETKPLWYGTGGRYIEAPHLYKFGEYYYILDAEGGTEYGHMVNYARGRSLWGPFEPFPQNPVLTNRNLGGYMLQGAGHGDIVEDQNRKWWFMHLAFRQSGQWLTYHHLGRECCLVPVEWKDGWFYMGDGTSHLAYELPDREAFIQERSFHKTFENLEKEWCFLRNYREENYVFDTKSLKLKGTKDNLFEGKLPTMAALRQNEFREEFSVTVESGCEEAGITVYMDERHHYDLYLDAKGNVVLRFTIGCVSKEMKTIPAAQKKVALKIEAKEEQYHFFAETQGGFAEMGCADTRYLSSEVAGGFTGVVFGLYAVDENGACAEFTELVKAYREEKAL